MKLEIGSTLRSGETVLATEDLAVGLGTSRPAPVRAQPGQPIVREASRRASGTARHSERSEESVADEPGRGSFASLRMTEGGIGMEASVLFRAEDLELRRGDRAAIVGPNGAGKTTFLRVITGEIEPAAGRLYVGYSVQLAYYAQAHEQLNPARTVIDEIYGAKSMGEADARNYLGRFLFSGDDAFKKVGSLSGGERSRLALAKLALGNANFLVLDEPTNHLDLYSREALEEVLREFKGTILFVSHDRYLIDALATQIWILEAGRLTARKQTWAEYVADRDSERAAAAARIERARQAAAAPSAQAEAAARTRAREAARRAERLEKLEAQIATTTAELHVVGSEIEAASAAADGERIAALGRKHDDLSKRLAELEHAWIVLHEADESAAALDVPASAGYRSG
jgi:ATP-binding cassette subfamily F protein 3